MPKLIPLLLAVLITLSLTLAMYGLIKMDEPDLETKSFKLPDFVHSDSNEDLQTIVARPDKPKEIEIQPDIPDVKVAPDRLDIDSNLGLGRIKVGINRSLKGFNSNDGEFLPIFRAPPQYPRRAAERGLCGWVDLSYTVTSTGGTRDAFVTDSSSSVFEGAGRKAALKYKYKPRQVGGKPVDVPGVEIRIRFELEDNEGCSDDKLSRNS